MMTTTEVRDHQCTMGLGFVRGRCESSGRYRLYTLLNGGHGVPPLSRTGERRAYPPLC